MHTSTILEGHSVHKQTSFRASKPFEDGLLDIGSKLLTFLPKEPKHYDQHEEAGSRSSFSYKNLWEKQISVWYGVVWSTNNSEYMEAPVPAINTVLAI